MALTSVCQIYINQHSSITLDVKTPGWSVPRGDLALPKGTTAKVELAVIRQRLWMQCQNTVSLSRSAEVLAKDRPPRAQSLHDKHVRPVTG